MEQRRTITRLLILLAVILVFCGVGVFGGWSRITYTGVLDYKNGQFIYKDGLYSQVDTFRFFWQPKYEMIYRSANYAIQNAIDALPEEGGAFYFPSNSIYEIDQAIQLRQNIKIITER